MHDRVLITGGAGFVGSNVALAMKSRFPDLKITAFDNLRRRGSELNLSRLAEAGVRFIHGDVRSSGDLLDLDENPDLIIECSAEPSAQAGYAESPEYLIQTNLTGCFNCLELARRVKASFLFLSTSRVYPIGLLNQLSYREEEGRFALNEEQLLPGASHLGISESFPLDGARSLYGMSKLSAELMVTEYADAYGLHCAIDRCGLIAGPWQMGKTDQGVVSLWMASHYFRQPLKYIGYGGTGKQVRDLLHIDDLADLIIEQASNMDRFAGSIFNVGGGLSGSVSLRELSVLCEQITGNRIHIDSCPTTRKADVPIYVTDHRQLTKFSGWKPLRSPEAILAGIFEWLRKNEPQLRTRFTCS